MRNIVIATGLVAQAYHLLNNVAVLTEDEYRLAQKLETVRKPRIEVTTVVPIQGSVPRKPKKDKSHLKRGSSYFNR